MARIANASSERGQAIVFVALAMVTLFGLAAFTVDFGYILWARQRLQATSDAAATAGALDIGVSGGNPTGKATLYSSVAGNKNATAGLPNVSISTQLKCVNSTGLPTCTSPSVNAITVTQTANLPLYFARLIGIPTKSISARATATMRGGGMPPLDIMLVLDTTRSMDDDCGSTSRLNCLKAGVRTLLSTLWPCAQGLANCGAVTNGNVVNPIDMVGMMVFPGLKASTDVSQEFDCNNNISDSEIAGYGSSPVYQIVALSSDYRTSTTSGLNSTSNLVKAVASNSCGIENPGGQGSYFTGALNAAQNALVANGRATVQNVIIFVSDGDATQYSGGPSNPCRGAVTAADTIAATGTWIYSIAYGAGGSGTCKNDKSPSTTAYATMQGIASDSKKFYSQPSNATLTDVFQKIGIDLMNTRMVDDDAP